MGTWGHGNLDSDYALDELAGRSRTLVDTLLRRAARPSSREADEADYVSLFIELEMVLALEAAGLLAGNVLPRPGPVEALVVDYLAGWDAYIDQLQPNAEHKRERRRVIVETFARFVQLCVQHDGPHKPSALPAALPEPKPAKRPAKPKKKKKATTKPKKPAAKTKKPRNLR